MRPIARVALLRATVNNVNDNGSGPTPRERGNLAHRGSHATARPGDATPHSESERGQPVIPQRQRDLAAMMQIVLKNMHDCDSIASSKASASLSKK